MESLDPEVFYKLLFENMLDGLAYCRIILDKYGNATDFVYTKVNKNFEKLTGLHNVVGKKATELMPGVQTSNRGLFEAYSRVALAGVTGKPERFEVYIKPLAKWFLITVYCPKKEFFISVFQNITDQKQIEKDLSNANTATRNVLEDLSFEKTKVEIAKANDEAILENIGEGLIALDTDKRITMINGAAANMLGSNIKKLLGKTITDFALEYENGQLVALDKRPSAIALATGRITKNIYTFVRANQTRFPMAITATPIKLNSKTIGLIEVIRDVTKEQEIDKAKTEFASLVSHQLRTPFSTINWYVEVLLSENTGKLNKKQKNYLKEVYKASKRMVDLVNVLLSISRIEMGKTTEQNEQVNIVSIAGVIIRERRREATEKSLNIVTFYGKNIPQFEADPKQISMIFQNLLSNAIKYTPESGTISVRIKVKNNQLLISVADTGIGIPKAAGSRMFSRFFRAENARQNVPEGAGLGLYILKAIVDQMNGKVWYDSDENKGTTFYLSFPLKSLVTKGKVVRSS